MIEPSMVVHTLNCDPRRFAEVAAGEKLFEVRLDDRNYQVGDHLDLRCATPRQAIRMNELSGRILAGGELTEEERAELGALRDCDRLRCLITSKVRLSGPIVPAEPHWWQPNEAMQHGVVVLGVRLEAAIGAPGCSCTEEQHDKHCMLHGTEPQLDAQPLPEGSIVKQEAASNLQAALRAYESQRQRLSAASEPSQVRHEAQQYLKAKRTFKEAVARADESDRTELDKLMDIAFDAEDRFIDLRSRGNWTPESARQVGLNFLANNEGDFAEGVDVRFTDPTGGEKTVHAAGDEVVELFELAKGKDGCSFAERVDAWLKLHPKATASDVATATGIGLREVMSVFEQRQAEHS